MSEWETTTIGEILARSGGSIKTGPFGTALKASEYTEAGVPVISVGEIGYGKFLVHPKTPRVNHKVLERLPEYILRKGDIVFGRKGAVDRSAVIDRNQDGWFLGSDGIRLRLPITCCPYFVGYWLRSRTIRQWLIQHAGGTTMASLNQGTISRIPIRLPNLAIQKLIVTYLGALDDKIELNRRMNSTLEAMARAIFKDWFVDFGPTRAKVEGGAPYLAADIWALFPDRLDDEGKPEGWGEIKIENLLELAYGKSLPAADRREGAVPVYGSGGLTGFHDQSLVDGPAIIVGRKGTVGSLYWEHRSCYPIDTVFYVRSLAPLSYCYNLLDTLRLTEMNTDAAVPGLNRSNVYRLLVPNAPSPLIKAFGVQADTCRAKVVANLSENETLASARDLLLPKLMSGEIRVKDAEKIVEAAR